MEADQLWEDSNLAEMPTAGPCYLEDVPQLRHQAPPITGEKRVRSLSESDLDLSQVLVAANALVPTPQVKSPVPTLVEDCYNDYLAALDRLHDQEASSGSSQRPSSRRYAPPGKLSRRPRKRAK